MEQRVKLEEKNNNPPPQKKIFSNYKAGTIKGERGEMEMEGGGAED